VIDRRAFVASFLALFTAPLTAAAQQAGKIPRIGILRPGSPPDPLIEAFRQGLRELGYAEGRDVTIEYRWTEGRDERLPDLAADLARLKVDIIVTSGLGTQAAKRATSTIPIVMQVSIDPVADGLVASLARPGGNITGLATSTEDVPGKWMELLKEVLPGVSRVAVLFDPTSSSAAQLKASEAAARSLGVRLQTLKVGRSDELGPAFAEAQKNRAEGLIIFGSAFVFAHRTRLVELAATHRLPTIYDQRQFVVSSGGLMSYGPNVHDLFRRAATYVDKILKGAKPGDLPIEQPTKFELVINLKTAKILGLTIPPAVLARADEVIQ
jgi:putative ABC transport system substrate-binding protein